MDLATHALTSFALSRGFFPRSGWGVTGGMIVAGTLADLDKVSAWFGPGNYLAWRGTYTHSIPAAIVIVVLSTFLAVRLSTKNPPSLQRVVAAMAIAALGHLLLDGCQSAGVVVLWPFTAKRFAADLLPAVDVWILALLVLGIVFPELFRLVGSEIGAKDKSPRGRNGAVVALAFALTYLGARAVLHGSAMTAMDAHAYRGESPRRIGAFADALSIFTWHSIVETHALVCQLDVPVGPAAVFNPEAAVCQHKPEPSLALDDAQQTPAATQFLKVARFPKASVEKIEAGGYEVRIQALENAAEQAFEHEVVARILLDEQSRVVQQELVWATNAARRSP